MFTPAVTSQQTSRPSDPSRSLFSSHLFLFLFSLLLSISLPHKFLFSTLSSLSLLSHSLVMSLFLSLNDNDNDHSYNELSELTALVASALAPPCLAKCSHHVERVCPGVSLCQKWACTCTGDGGVLLVVCRVVSCLLCCYYA